MLQRMSINSPRAGLLRLPLPWRHGNRENKEAGRPALRTLAVSWVNGRFWHIGLLKVTAKTVVSFLHWELTHECHSTVKD